jgi:hypothetical protein
VPATEHGPESLAASSQKFSRERGFCDRKHSDDSRR